MMAILQEHPKITDKENHGTTPAQEEHNQKKKKLISITIFSENLSDACWKILIRIVKERTK